MMSKVWQKCVHPRILSPFRMCDDAFLEKGVAQSWNQNVAENYLLVKWMRKYRLGGHQTHTGGVEC